MAAVEIVRVGFFHVLIVYLRFGPVVGKPSMPVSLFLEASRIKKQIQSARTCCELDRVLSGIGRIFLWLLALLLSACCQAIAS